MEMYLIFLLKVIIVIGGGLLGNLLIRKSTDIEKNNGRSNLESNLFFYTGSFAMVVSLAVASTDENLQFLV